jgi:hypothetical protein
LSKAGKRQSHIANELGVDVRRVRNEQRRSGLPIIKNGLAPNLVEKICELTRKGEFQKTICRDLKLNQITVRKYQLLHGLPTARPPFVVSAKVEQEIKRKLKREQPGWRIAKQVGLSLYYVRKVGRSQKEATA